MSAATGPFLQSVRQGAEGIEPVSRWEVCPGNSGDLKVGGDEVHVWLASLDLSREALDTLMQPTDENERARAQRFRFQPDRERYLAAHGVLRRILAAYTRKRPDQLSFIHGPWGKPALAAGEATDAIQFNLSYSHGAALCAVASGRQVGIDIERLWPKGPFEGVAQRHFSPEEYGDLLGQPLPSRAGAFFTLWTLKEAYVKAIGLGLSKPLHSFSVSLARSGGAALLDDRDHPRGNHSWTVRTLPAISGYAAGLAFEGAATNLRCWNW